MGVACYLLPTACGGELLQEIVRGGDGRNAMELGLEPVGDLCEEVDLLGQGGADLGKPFTLGMAVGLGRGIGLGMGSVGTRGGIVPQRLADPVQDDGTAGIHFLTPRSFFHCSWKDFGASFGKFREPVQARRGSRIVPFTKP